MPNDATYLQVQAQRHHTPRRPDRLASLVGTPGDDSPRPHVQDAPPPDPGGWRVLFGRHRRPVRSSRPS